MAWLIAKHQDILSKNFILYSPPFDTIKTLLDKRALYRACERVGIGTVNAHYPANFAELAVAARSITYPALIKLATQAFLPTSDKGVIVDSETELFQRVRTFVEHPWYAESFVADSPDIVWPMIQEYYPESADSVYGLSGFIDQQGTLYDMRASRKVLQYPRKLGVGLCFEEVTVDLDLKDKVVDLCRLLGYWGVFEVEFVRPQGSQASLLIDFNPRYFHQMQFDIARGMELPAMVYYAATGNEARLSAELERSCRQACSVDMRIITHRILFDVMLITQRLSGSMSAQEVRQRRDWYHQSGQVSDMVRDWTDPIPVLVNLLHLLRHHLRYPGYFIRTFGGSVMYLVF